RGATVREMSRRSTHLVEPAYPRPQSHASRVVLVRLPDGTAVPERTRHAPVPGDQRTRSIDVLGLERRVPVRTRIPGLVHHRAGRSQINGSFLESGTNVY